MWIMHAAWLAALVCLHFTSLNLEGKAILDAISNTSYRADEQQLREKRQQAPDEEPPACDFGSDTALTLCSWTNPINTSRRLQWKLGLGQTAYWLGGPRMDHSSSDQSGGYAFFETSIEPPDATKSVRTRTVSEPEPPFPSVGNTASLVDGSQTDDGGRETALLVSRNISRTGAKGLCLSFFFYIEGLSADSLRVLLKDLETGENSTIWQSSEAALGLWRKGELAYTYGGLHLAAKLKRYILAEIFLALAILGTRSLLLILNFPKILIIFEGIPKRYGDPARQFRGFIALDDIQFQQLERDAPDNCLGHCTFEGGFCGWTNLDDDDFDWQLGRSSDSFLTGPSRDYSGFGRSDSTGGYSYIDASFPRRPGDSARLMSPPFQATGDNSPICMHFATHMFGNGIGILRVMQRDQGSDVDEILWEINGEAGNNWYTAQVSISAATPYQLLFEGIVGVNSLGNIAIDTISFHSGTCPISPQAAATELGDCNFEEDTCGWTNVAPSEGVDDFDWARQYSFSINSPTTDHTKGTADGYYVNLASNSELPQRGGTRAWLISPKFSPPANQKCLSFYYYMYERTIDPLGPSLGSLKVYVKPVATEGTSKMTLIWRLSNHQGQRWLMARTPITTGKERAIPTEDHQVVIEGIWGDGRVGYIALDDISIFDGDCSTEPTKARAVTGECSFDRDMCGWMNVSEKQASHLRLRPRDKHADLKTGEALQWRLATITNRPANLQDHTFRAQGGYVFFDIFNQVAAQRPVLRSPVFEPSLNEAGCVCFRFAPFGRGDSTTLLVYRVDATDPENLGERTLVWKLPTRRTETNRPEWQFGQAPIDTGSEYVIEFEGEATDGGFALDDIIFFEGTCLTRPERATVGSQGSGV